MASSTRNELKWDRQSEANYPVCVLQRVLNVSCKTQREVLVVFQEGEIGTDKQ